MSDLPTYPGAEASFPPGHAYVNGAFCPIAEARISVLDWGLLRSDATYDVVHVWRRRFFRLDAHLARFERSAARLRLALPFDRAGLAAVLKEVVRRSGLDDAYVEAILTRGRAPGFGRDPRQGVPSFIAFAVPFGWLADEAQRARGLDATVAGQRRIPPESVDPRVKNYHWLDLVMGLYEAFDRGGETVMLTDGAGHVAEGPGFNVFAVKQGRATTPDAGVLEGITRETALLLLEELGVPAAAAPLPVEALRAADEAFVTSTAGGIVPLTRLDGQAIGDGRPGPVTARLTELYWAKHDDPAWTTPVDD